MSVIMMLLSGRAIWKLGFVATIYATNRERRGFWTDRGYKWFSGI